MDVASLLTLLLLALALAVQPWSVLAAVLLITSEGGVAKAMAYVAGWVLALAAVAVATITLYPATPKVAAGSPWASWVEIGTGVALGGWLLLRARRHVPASSEGAASGAQSQSPQQAEAPPRWMARLDSMSPLPAFALGAFLPNYAVVVAAVSNVVQAGLSQGQAAVLLVLFIVLASAGVAAPLLLLLFRREQAPAVYQQWRVWLRANGHRVLTAVLAVVVLVLIVKGIIGLLT